MKDEIKEILEDVKRHLDYVETTKQSSIRDNEMKVMYDYITNLQEGNKNLLEEVENIQNQNNKSIDIINELEEYCWELKAMGCREGALDMLDKIKELKENK